MANKFVWSGATGANDGSSWADAYTSLMRDWGAEAGFTPATDYIYVRSIHSESSAAVKIITGSTADATVAPCRIYSVTGAATGTDPGTRAAGASVTTTGSYRIEIDEGLYIDGVKFYGGSSIYVGYGSSLSDITSEECTYEVTAGYLYLGSTGGRHNIHWIETDLTFTSADQGIAWGQCYFLWEGGALLYNINRLFLDDEWGYGTLEVRALDLSVLVSNALVYADWLSTPTRFKFSRCLLASTTVAYDGELDHPGAIIEIYHCQAGTDTDPAYQFAVYTINGKIAADAAHYRTGGASDGERSLPYSWNLDTTIAGSRVSYPGHELTSIPITVWSDGDGSTQHTYRIYFASDSTLTDDDIWMELLGPNDTATSSLASRKTNRCAPLGTPANHTTDAVSTWNGTGVTTKQYMQIQYTPDKQGVVEVRICFANPSDVVYVDPKIYIDP